jgi:hypothetical protein
MVDSVAEVQKIVQAACEEIADPTIREAVEKHLIEPRLQLRTWEYGESASFPIWLIADTGERGAGIGYSE